MLGCEQWEQSMKKLFSTSALGLCLLLPLFILPTFPAAADSNDQIEEVVVSASLIPIAANRSANAITVIDSEQIRLRAASSIGDLLRDVPGFAVSQSGGVGSLTEIRARGAESNHLVVLIDGIEANDPSTGDQLNWGTFSTTEIDRIEIIRGPQSAIQGSDAIAGVVNIITTSANQPYSANIYSEFGSFSSSRNGFSVGHKSEKLNIKFGASHYETAGDNIRPSTGSLDDDGYRNTGVNLKAVYEVNDKLSLSLTNRHSSGMAEYDGYNLANQSMRSEFDREFSKIQGDFNSANGLWFHAISMAESDFENNEFNNTSPNGGSESSKKSYQYTGSRFIENKNQQISLSLEKETQNFKQHVSFGEDNNKVLERNVDSFALEYRFDPSDSITLAASSRYEDNDSFEDSTTGRVEAIYRQFDNVKWRAAWGKAVKSPTFTELYGDFERFEANEYLMPEKSNSWESGVDASLLDDRLQLAVTYFNSKLENEIYTVYSDCDPSGWPCDMSLDNRIQKSNRKGFEFSSSVAINDVIQASAAYTYTDSKDASGNVEARRAKNIGSINISWQARPDANINLNVQHNGSQAGYSPTDGYTLVNLNANYNANEKLDIYMSLNNLFDKNYQDVAGYETLGFGANMGLRYKF